MSGIDPIVAIAAQAANALSAQPAADASSASAASFADLLTRGLEHVENKVETANRLVRAFAIDDSVPIHEVTIALEEARIAVELAAQVRARVIEGYRELMNMQL
jgi:flagellar hook-basal body complex protein FliE